MSWSHSVRIEFPFQKEIKGVELTDQQYKDLVEGKAIKVEGMLSKNNKPFDATLQSQCGEERYRIYL